MTAMRIQVMVYDTLQMEVIVEQHMVDKTLSAWYNRKLDKGQLIGGAIIQRADLPRYWVSS